MLERLEVSNYVLIRSLVLDFTSGFAVLTGETGSGKSIILGALGLILGEKSKGDVVRQGEKEARIEALFSYRSGGSVEAYLKENGLEDEDGGLFIQRIVRSSGRSIMSVNGYSVTREQLEVLGQMLVDVSSQHAHQSLLRPAIQLSLLDKAAHSAPLLASYRQAYDELMQARKEQQRLIEENAKASQEADYISFCLDEIEKADVRVGEDDELSAQLKLIGQSEVLTGELEEAQEALRGGNDLGALSLISRCLNAVVKASRADARLDVYRERIESASIELEDIASSLGEYLSSISFSEDELEEKSARLALLQRLKKKYGGSLEAVVSRRDEYRSALSTIENFEDLLAESGRRVEKAERELMRTGEALSAHRGSCARSLEKTIQGNLASLGLKSAVFRIVITRRQAEANGMDDVVFTLAANKGEKEGPVSQVASGGELSRIMLAIKSALTAEDEVETLLFDEIDSGLGGVVANSVAMELDKLSRSHQVIAITHLAQIAAKARTHYMVYKREEAGRTISSIGEISGEDRVDEIARLLSGEVSGISRQHAASLLSQ